jgi:hypothetical protein
VFAIVIEEGVADCNRIIVVRFGFEYFLFDLCSNLRVV